jgi:hypothetical protein
MVIKGLTILMASHGGFREGSGRPAGASNKAMSGLKPNLSELASIYARCFRLAGRSDEDGEE